MNRYLVALKGFFGEVLFARFIEADSRPHAVRMVAAEYNGCYLRAEIKAESELMATCKKCGTLKETEHALAEVQREYVAK